MFGGGCELLDSFHLQRLSAYGAVGGNAVGQTGRIVDPYLGAMCEHAVLILAIRMQQSRLACRKVGDQNSDGSFHNCIRVADRDGNLLGLRGLVK